MMNKQSAKKNINKQKSKKAVVHQIIDLEQVQNAEDAFRQQQIFISQLAKKCGHFFNWINHDDSSMLAQQLWKNKMMQKAGQKCPQLNIEQLQKLIDRDWRIMSEQNKKKIISQYQYQPDINILQRMINHDFDIERNKIIVQVSMKDAKNINGNYDERDEQIIVQE